MFIESSSEDRSPRDFEIIVKDDSDDSKDSNTMNLSLNIGGCTLNTYDDDFITAKVSIADGSDTNNIESLNEIAKSINLMPIDNVPYFLTLIRFQYAVVNK